MRELIRHILKESSSKIRLLKVIEDEGVFNAAELVGGLNNLKKILKDILLYKFINYTIYHP